jgi:hypothetical protein
MYHWAAIDEVSARFSVDDFTVMEVETGIDYCRTTPDDEQPMNIEILLLFLPIPDHGYDGVCMV